MNVDIAPFVEELLAYAPGCPAPLARRELLRASQRFCRDVYVLRRDVPFTQPADTPDHTFDLTAEKLKVIKPVEVTVNGRVISSKQQEYLRQRNLFYREVTAPEPRFYFSKREGAMSFFPVPEQDAAIVAVVACYPADDYEGIPEEVAYQWRDAVIGGALLRICATPAQPYTNPEIAGMGGAWFRQGVSLARVYVNNSYGGTAQVVMRPFATGKRRF